MAEASDIGGAQTAGRALARATAQLLVVLAMIEAVRREFLGERPPAYPAVAIVALLGAWVSLAVTALWAARRERLRGQ